MKITPKNWREFQHYKDRNPPWIRLHKGLLDNFDFQRLPVASRALAPMLWLLASDSLDGVIDADPERLAFRLRMSVDEVREALKPLIEKEFFLLVDGASNVLAECLQHAVPETEALQRQRTEADASRADADRSAPALGEAFLVAQGINPQHAKDWLKVRKGKRAPLTETAWDDLKNEANKAGITPAEAVRHCARKSWQGFNASWNWRDEAGDKMSSDAFAGAL